MTIIAAILRTLGLPVCIIIALLAYYEGLPLLRDVPFVGHIPVIRELVTGRVASESMKAANAARAGYVVEARATAAEAKAAELQRQLTAGQLVIASYEEIAKNDRLREQQSITDFETRNLSNEAKLRAEGRSWLLNQSDVDFVLKP